MYFTDDELVKNFRRSLETINFKPVGWSLDSPKLLDKALCGINFSFDIGEPEITITGAYHLGTCLATSLSGYFIVTLVRDGFLYPTEEAFLRHLKEVAIRQAQCTAYLVRELRQRFRGTGITDRDKEHFSQLLRKDNAKSLDSLYDGTFIVKNPHFPKKGDFIVTPNRVLQVQEITESLINFMENQHGKNKL